MWRYNLIELPPLRGLSVKSLSTFSYLPLIKECLRLARMSKCGNSKYVTSNLTLRPPEITYVKDTWSTFPA